MFDFIRVAAAVPEVSVGNVDANVVKIIEKAAEADKKGVQLTVFPELAITGYSCGDLFFQSSLLSAAKKGLRDIAKASEKLDTVIVVGLPFDFDGRLFNCAAVVFGGKVYAIIPKTYLPVYSEFYEPRWFTPGSELENGTRTCRELQDEPFAVGTDMIFDTGFFRFGTEICEDIWAPIPPSNYMALAGAEVLLNLSASNEKISKRRYRRAMIQQHSASQTGAYIYVSSGCTESTTDLIFSGHSLICESGKLMAENEKLIDSDYLLISDIDLEKIRNGRLRFKTYAQCAALCNAGKSFRSITLPCPTPDCDFSLYPIRKLPFVPDAKTDRAERCSDIFEMQVMALKRRLDITHARPVVGVSGGLDSTLALLVSAEAVRRSGKPLTDVVGITMPCFGTTGRTYNNSLKLMEKLGVTYLEIPIKSAVEQHFRDIGQDPAKYDLTFENSQARERTQVLMDYAGKVGGLVVGTGDLSELALGWCTYNADHMSMYGVNAGVPKTLVRWMIDTIKDHEEFAACGDVIRDILDTPISPELLPPDEKGQIAQQTEDIVGPYALHDFFLFYAIRQGYSPKKVFDFAARAFADDFDKATVKKWLIVFYRRFFSQQYKRSCQPDGVKIGSTSLSPRGDWRMPSDASAALWIKEAEEIEI